MKNFLEVVLPLKKDKILTTIRVGLEILLITLMWFDCKTALYVVVTGLTIQGELQTILNRLARLIFEEELQSVLDRLTRTNNTLK